MADKAGLQTLAFAFASGAVEAPSPGTSGLFLGALPGLVLDQSILAGLTCIQGFRPHYLALLREGLGAWPAPAGEDHHFALLLADRHRGANEVRLAEAIQRVRGGGLIVLAGSKEAGIASLRRLAETFVELKGSLAKYHGQVFWFRRSEESWAAVSRLREANPALLVDNRFWTAPGMFSHGRADAGSRLLASCLPQAFQGRAADFGAGWGYLSAMLAERISGLTSLDLYEADHASLEAAKRNLATFSARLPLGFHWHDLIGEPVRKKYDLIVMNPPFHQSRAADPGIGQAFIGVAASALNAGGMLFLVANRGLPYDAVLRESFSIVSELARESGYRVLAARK